MTTDAQRIREALRSHEHLAPDTAGVLMHAKLLAAGYRRRRRAARSVGGAVASAGLVAAVTAGPGVVGDLTRSDAVEASAVGAGGAAPSPDPVATTAAPAPVASEPAASEEDLRAAFFGRGLDFDDALVLAEVWGLRDEGGDWDYDAAKADAGRRILAGETLPDTTGPSPSPSAPASPVAPAPADAEADAARAAFFAAGYDYDDAVQLATLWDSPDVTTAKADAGARLLAGETLPVRP